MPTTLDGLQDLVRESESSRVELKKEISEEVIKGLSTDIAAIANYEGGHIVFGFTDKEKDPVGCVIQNEDLERISQQAGNCSPSVTIDFERVSLGSRDFLLVNVPKSSTLHRDARYRFPMRTGNITTYLDIAGIEMHMKLRGLLQGEELVTIQARPEEKRKHIPNREASVTIEGLTSENPVVRLETLRDLNTMKHRYVLFEDEGIARPAREILNTGSEKEINLILDVIRGIAFQGTSSEKETISRWMDRIFEVGKSAGSLELARRAYDILEAWGHQTAVDLLIYWITETNDDKYSALHPESLLTNTRFHGLDSRIRESMYRLLRAEKGEDVSGRVSKILEAIRNSY